jgi:hypothetical protein
MANEGDTRAALVSGLARALADAWRAQQNESPDTAGRRAGLETRALEARSDGQRTTTAA